MIKATLISLLVGLLFLVFYALDLYAFLSLKIVYYIALVVMIITLIAARIILGNPLEKSNKDDKGDA